MLPAIPDANTHKQRKPRAISRRMRQVLINLATKGVTQREAARLAGMNESHLSRELRKPQIQEFIARKARETLTLGTLRASARVVELIDADSGHVALDASKHVLALDGIAPQERGQVAVNVGVSVGYVIDLAGPRETPKPAIENDSQ